MTNKDRLGANNKKLRGKLRCGQIDKELLFGPKVSPIIEKSGKGSLTNSRSLFSKQIEKALSFDLDRGKWIERFKDNQRLGLSKKYLDNYQRILGQSYRNYQKQILNSYKKYHAREIKNRRIYNLVRQLGTTKINLPATSVGLTVVFKQWIKPLDFLAQNGWCVVSTRDFKFLDAIKEVHKTHAIVLESQYYDKNKVISIISKLIKEMQDNLLLQLPEGYVEEFQKIRDILNKDFDCYYLFCGNFFAMCEFIFFKYLESMRLVDEGQYVNFSTIKNLKNFKNERVNKLEINSQKIMKMKSAFTVMNKYWKSSGHKKDPKKTKFCRDNVQHGFVDPLSIKKTDFAKIVLLLYSLSTLRPMNISNEV